MGYCFFLEVIFSDNLYTSYLFYWYTVNQILHIYKTPIFFKLGNCLSFKNKISHKEQKTPTLSVFYSSMILFLQFS